MKKRFTLVQQVLGILLVGFSVVFVAGFSVLRGFQLSNLQYIYRQTQALVASSVDGTEANLQDIGTLIYDLVVSDTVQQAGSAYLLLQDVDNSMFSQVTSLDTITDEIQKTIINNKLITCANFLDIHGTVRAVASTGYLKLTDEAAKIVEQVAIEARGGTVFLDGQALLGRENTLLFIKELREKKDLSMRHIGVIVLMVDMKRVGAVLANAYNGTYLLQNEPYGLEYLFNDSGAAAQNEPVFAQADIHRKGYALVNIGREYYYVTEFSRDGYVFSYRVLLPYNSLFYEVEQLFTRFVSIFILCSLTVLLLCVVLMRRVTMDIKRLRDHIGNITDVADIPRCENIPLHNRDSYELYTTFNRMTDTINQLIRDNYQKQILVKETQLATLQAQINPHFLYNTLNSIYWMAKKTEDPRLADMIDSLSRLLREATNIGETLIDIDRELEIVCHYARIQKQRYAERLCLTFDVAEECGSLAIPKFTLQPMLENAIHYGLECMLGPCGIRICIFAEGDDCVCQVRNKGPAPVENLMEKLKKGEVALQGNGVGLLNIDRRIKTVFGEHYGVTVMRDDAQKETVVQARFQKRFLTEWEA